MTLAHVAASTLPAFLASLVEFVEALTIVLAVGVTRGWRSAWVGTVAGVVTLTIVVVAFGPLLRFVPIAILQSVVGVLLVFFGLRWLRKAILRYAGAIALHDEALIFARKRDGLAQPDRTKHTDWQAIATAFNAVVLEGLEVVFIVIAVGATARTLGYASLGAAAAGIVVIGAGAVARGPLARVPENALKFAVGIMLSAFGTFWTGEGFHETWPGGDVALLCLVACYAAVAGIGILIARADLRADVPRNA